jgi:hypothetical protein
MIWFLVGVALVIFGWWCIKSVSTPEPPKSGPIVTSMSSDDFLDYYLDLMDEKDARKKGKHYDYPDGY